MVYRYVADNVIWRKYEIFSATSFVSQWIRAPFLLPFRGTCSCYHIYKMRRYVKHYCLAKISVFRCNIAIWVSMLQQFVISFPYYFKHVCLNFFSLRPDSCFWLTIYFLQPPKFEFYDPKTPFYTSPGFLPPTKIDKCRVCWCTLSSNLWIWWITFLLMF